MVDDEQKAQLAARLAAARAVVADLEQQLREAGVTLPGGEAAGQPPGAVVGAEPIAHDISAAKRAQDEAHANAAKYGALFTAFPVGISIADVTGQIVESNAEAEKLLGISAEEQHQRTVDGPEWRIIRPDGSPMPVAEFASVRALHEQRRVADVEMGIVKASGAVTWISVTAAPLPGYGVAIAYFDVTRRRELEQRVAERTAELQAMVSELHEANNGKDAFLAAVSHELRTPLTGILGASEALQLQMNGQLNPLQLRYAAVIHESGERLLATVNDVLLYTGLMAGKAPIQRQRCRIVDLCGAAVRPILPKAERKSQSVAVDVQPSSLEMESDQIGIINVLTMLLDNAVKFTPPHGSIGVEAVSAPEADAVRLVVWDSGIGIAAEVLDHLFAPFTQAEQTLARRFEGLGLGLAYVHEMVKRLGGTITVESQLDHGSRFIITLPTRMR